MATLRQKINLLRGLLDGETAHTDPFFVTVDTTRRCNLSCAGCRYHSSGLSMPSPGDQDVRETPYELFDRLCGELETMTTGVMILIGEGEPMLYPRIFDVIARAKSAGLTVEMFTNGTLLTDANCEQLIDSGLDTLKVSLWATSREEYARNYAGTDPVWFDRTVEGLRRLSKAKAARGSATPCVKLHQPVNRHNSRSVDAAADLALETGCNTISFSPFKTHRGGLADQALSPEQERGLCASLVRLRRRLKPLPLSHNIDDVLLRYKVGEAVWERVPCYIGWFHARIKVDGTVLPCNPCDRPMGNINDHSFREVWHGPAFRAFRRQGLTLPGLKAMTEECDCGFCCHTPDNARVHRLFKWIPVRRKAPCSET